MSREELTTLGETPALVVVPSAEHGEGGRGTVLLLHGLGESKEWRLREARWLAERGYLTIVLDAVGHGPRRSPDLEQCLGPEGGEGSYADVVRRTAEELSSVVAIAAERGWVRPGCLGACGISMGGAALFGAVSSDCSFDAVATIVASPKWRHTADSPHQRHDRFFPTALLMQCAGADSVISTPHTRDLHRALVPKYASSPERLRYVEYDAEGHVPTAPAWLCIWHEVFAWFDRFLRPTSGVSSTSR